MIKRILIIFIHILVSANVVGQGFDPDGEKPKTSALRTFIGNFTFTLSGGYGRTFYTHELPGLSILDSNGQIYITESTSSGSGSSVSAYQYWMNNPSQVNGTINSGDQLFSSDSSNYKMKGIGTNIPVSFTIHYNFLEKFRIGGGATFELHSINKVRPKFTDTLGLYHSDYNIAFFKRYFGMFGYNFLNFRYLSYVAEMKIGAFSLGGKYNKALISKGIFFDVGVSIEKHLSEYFRVILKPSIELKNYNIALPDAGTSLKHKMFTPYLTLGASYRLPKLARCPIKACHVQIDHVHGGKKYRSRRHPIYKWQHPNYGQNDPELIKYKGKNKRKL